MMTTCPAYVRRGEGRSYRMGRITLTFKAGDSDYSICETLNEPRGHGSLPSPPCIVPRNPHRSRNMNSRLAMRIVQLGPGGMAFMPKGVVHAVRKISDGVGRQWIISSPAGIFEAFVAEVTAAQVDTGSAHRAGPADFPQIAAKHGIEFLD